MAQEDFLSEEEFERQVLAAVLEADRLADTFMEKPATRLDREASLIRGLPGFLDHSVLEPRQSKSPEEV